MHPWPEPFMFKDGSAVTDIGGLVYKLKTMSDNDFSNYVTFSKNDFANWVKYSLKMDQLADNIAVTRDRLSMIHVLEGGQSPHQYPVVEKPEVKVREFHPQAIPSEEKELPVQETTQVSEPVQTPEPEVAQPVQPEPEPVKTPEPVAQEKAAESSYMPKQEAPIEPAAPVKEDVPKQVNIQEKDTSFEPPKDTPTSSGEDADYDPNDTASMGEQVTIKELKEDKLISEEEVHKFSENLTEMQAQVHKVFIGQEETVHMGFISLLCEAHMLLEGVPGLAKSVLVETMAKTITGSKFSRIQFMPDILPADVIGGQIYNPKTGEFSVVKGPIFGNFVLADEINRAPPKTHAALMEAMAERKINIDKEEFILDRPFLVMATQNPLENKGTYELPEAVMDRFMFKVDMDYPKRKEEIVIISENNTTKAGLRKTVQPVITKDEIKYMMRKVKTIHISDRIREYILDIVEATRGINKKIQGIKFVKYGAGPRASIALGIAGKAQAMMMGRNYVLPEDINVVCKSILRHRVSLNFKGKAYNISSDRIVDEILEKVVAL